MVSPRPLQRRLGIMQGRLVPSRTGALDCPPGPRWREEFDIAAALGLRHIELVAERALDPTNVLWSAPGRQEIVDAVTSTGVQAVSLCANEPLDRRLDEPGFAADLARRLTPVVGALGILVVVLPLLEASDLARLDRTAAVGAVRTLDEVLARQGARVVLELSIAAAEAAALLDDIGSPQVGVCYDVGNATALGLDAPAEIVLLGDRVRHVHAKDKDADGQNVRFGTGDVPFAAVVEALATVAYDGLVTMEATRGDDPIFTAAEHRALLVSLGDTVGAGVP